MPTCEAPFIVRFAPAVVSAGSIHEEVETFRLKFVDGEDKKKRGRAQQLVANASECLELFSGLLRPELGCIPYGELKNHKVKDHLKPLIFGIAAGKETASFESSHLSTVRLTFSGTREVVVIPGAALLAYLQENRPAAPEMKEISNIVKAWTATDAQKFQQVTKAEVQVLCESKLSYIYPMNYSAVHTNVLRLLS